MVTVKIWGGLGNQLFQYAYGYSIAKKTGDILRLDVKFFDKQYSYVGKRSFELNKLACDCNFAPKREGIIRFFELFWVNRLIQRYKPMIKFRVGNIVFIKEKKKTFMKPILPKKNDNIYYDGYWQTSLYFSEFRNELKEMFRYSGQYSDEVQSFYSRIKQNKNSVSVHIRRGDFCTNSKIGHCTDIEYYVRAINYISENVETPIFFVFSDDIPWVKENLIVDAELIYADYSCSDGPIIDFELMTECKHGIMSASTFSWWGNWLKCIEKDTIIIAPKGEYYNNKFIENDWVRL